MGDRGGIFQLGSPQVREGYTKSLLLLQSLVSQGIYIPQDIIEELNSPITEAEQLIATIAIYSYNTQHSNSFPDIVYYDDMLTELNFSISRGLVDVPHEVDLELCFAKTDAQKAIAIRVIHFYLNQSQILSE